MTEHPFAVLLSILDRRVSDPICICHKTDAGPMGYVWTTAGEAPSVADRFAGAEHVWFGVQPMAPPLGVGRGRSRDVLALRTLYVDLDYIAEGKIGGMLPTTAMDIVEALSVIVGVGPVAIVASGYGVQPYWVLDSDVDVIDGALLLARWRAMVINVAAAHDAVVDTGVFDLPRILRVPGPPNIKRGGSARTGLIVPRGSSRLSLGAINAALDAYAPVTDSLRIVHEANVGRLSGAMPCNGHPRDRVFTDAEAMDFITEFALERVQSTPWGSGADFWKVIWEAAMTCSNFTDMFAEDSLKEMLRDAVALGHSGIGTDAADEYQIAMGFMKGGEWLARRPTEADEINPFSHHCTLAPVLVEGPLGPDGPPGEGAPEWFGKAGLRALVCADHLRTLAPVARTRESGVAVYASGVYRINEAALRMVTIGMLGDRWNLAHHNTISTVVAAQLYSEGRVLPERMAEPLVNFTNGLLDLRTLLMRPHDPEYVSTFQLPFAWEPTAACPTYLRWVEMIGITEQLVDLEETVGSMLDPSRTPTKALFVFGPARSGKSTYLRLMAAAVGPERTSGLSLQDLAGNNRFAAANLYGMVLNVCADLSAAHVEDVSLFKKLTGQDLIFADRKYGGQFTFTNTALFAFSGNTLPTVSESSRAYLERMKPISFASSFAGAEDPSIEDAMMDELPGIVARWVRAYHQRLVRGTATPTLPRVAAQFAEASNRVSLWLASEVDAGEGYWATTTILYDAFKRWCDQEGGAKAMGKTKFAEQLRSAAVPEVRNSATKVRGWQAYPKLFSG